MMISEIFNEIFGDDFASTFEKNFKKFEKRINEMKEDDGEEHSYYHKVEDEYENGKKTLHTEFEVKDGEVLKDLQEIHSNEEAIPKAIEAVEDDKEEDPYDIIDYYRQKCDEFRSKISEKNEEIDNLKGRCQTLENENNSIKSALKELIQPQKKCRK